MTYSLPCDNSSALARKQRLAARAALVSVALGSFMVALDVTALNVALPSIGRAFVVGLDRLQWIAGAYTLVFASLLLAAGSVSDRLGARGTFITGLIVFIAASIACGGAPGITSLIAARAAQGLGAAIMLPSSMALLTDAYPDPTARARAIALWGGLSAVGLVAGPVVGGILCQLAGWRAIFYLNAPFCLIAIAAAWFCCGRRAERSRAFDPYGLALSSLALASITFALIEAPALGWSAAPIVTALCTGAVSAFALAAVERRRAEPMLPPQLFASAAFTASVGVAFLQTFAYFGMLFILPIALQVHGGEPIAIGLRLAPMTITTGVVATFSGHLAEAFGARRVAALGLLAGTTGALMLYALGVERGPFTLATIALGIGGATLPLIVAASLAGVPSYRTGIASGIMNAARQSGGVLGIAVLGGLMNNGRLDARPALLVVAISFLAAAMLTFARLHRSGRFVAAVEA